MQPVHAFKFLGPGSRGRFSGLAWPLPEGTAPGAWVEVDAKLQACRSGIHACRAHELPYWLDAELWRVELAGELVDGPSSLIARRGRLLARVVAWDGELRDAFVAFCLQRVEQVVAQAEDVRLAQRYLDDATALAQAGQIAAVAFVSAVSARCLPGRDEAQAYLAARAEQAAWFEGMLA